MSPVRPTSAHGNPSARKDAPRASRLVAFAAGVLVRLAIELVRRSRRPRTAGSHRPAPGRAHFLIPSFHTGPSDVCFYCHARGHELERACRGPVFEPHQVQA